MEYYRTADTPAIEKLHEYIDWCENVRNMTKQTIIHKKSILGNFLRDAKIYDLHDITEKEINAGLKLRITGSETVPKVHVNGASVIRHQVVAFIRWVHETDGGLKIRIPYIAEIKGEPTSRKFYSAEEIARIVSETEDIETKTIISLAFDTGLRLSELSRMKIEDMRGNTIKTIGKGRKLGFVYISDRTVKLIEQITTGRTEGCVFERMNYNKTPVYISNLTKKAFKAAGYDNFQFHELRHSFATDLQKKGARIDEIQKLMRHSNASITEKYLHGLDGVMADVWNKYKQGF